MVLVIGGGTAYRMASARLERSSISVPIPKGTLSRLAMTIGDWQGRDVSMSERVVEATDSDDHINRAYRRSPYEVVSLFVAYGVHLRDLMPHRPEVCYRGAGWTLDDSEQLDIGLGSGQTLPCRLHHFRRGGLETKTITVLNYYLIDGQHCPDVADLRSRAWHFEPTASYAAQVQITVSGHNLGERGDQLVKDFAADFALPIRSLLVEAVRNASSQPN